MADAITVLFEWFDWHAWGYWALALSAFGLLLATVAAAVAAPAQAGGGPRFHRIAASRTLFVVAVLLTFFAFRWPAFFAGQMENPDEAQLIAGALTLREGGLPWKNVDGQTSGPINHYALLLTGPLGLPLNYLGARVLASLFLAGTVLALHGSMRRHMPEWIARLAILPAVPFWAFGTFHDLLQFSSEQTPLLLLALAGWLATAALTRRTGLLALVGLALAGALTATPFFAKPQALPLQGVLLGLLVGAIWRPRTTGPDNSRRRAESLALLGGALVPLAVFVGYISLYGLWDQIRVFFWQSNALYAGNRGYPFNAIPEALFRIANPAPGVTATLLGTIGFCLAAVVPTWSAHREGRPRLLGAWLSVGAGLVAVFTPGRYFIHYLNFLVPPLCWCAAVHLDGARRWFGSPAITAGRQAHGTLALVFALAVLAWPTWERLELYRPMNGQLFFWQQRQTSPVAERIRAEARPGDRLVVWGWAPGYHVETGLPQGAREAITERSLDNGPLQASYRWRLLFDLRRNRPRWFVDAVAPGQFGYRDRSLSGHETWPELRDIVATEYERVDELAGVRIYRRRDRPDAPSGKNNLAPSQPAP
jgi:hypothetical protein